MHKDIDGLVTKDDLYRLMSKLKMQSILTEEQVNIICEEIVKIPKFGNELFTKGGDLMTWRQVEKLIRDRFDVAVETECETAHNKYWIKKWELSGPVYYPLTSHQFERLLDEGYIDPDYHMEYNHGLYGDQMIYRGR